MQNEPALIITISGDLGSGKSVLAERLSKHFEADRYSTGNAQRTLAAEMGITTLELNQRADTDHTIDDRIDAVFKSLSETKTNLIVDSRMAWFFLPRSFKIKLEVAPEVAADRISKDNTRIGEGDTSPNVILQSILDRRRSEKERFLRYYDADITAKDNYNLVVNTHGVAPDDIAACVIQCIEKWQAKQPYDLYWVAPSLVKTDKAADQDTTSGHDKPMIMQKKADYFLLSGLDTLNQALADEKPLIAVEDVPHSDV